MELLVWVDFNKQDTSTLLPPPQPSAIWDVKLKGKCSLIEPVFLVQSDPDSMGRINYCKWFNRYYFVEDVVFVTSVMVELHCKIDILASHKNIILRNYQFVERAANNYDVTLYDPLIAKTIDTAYTGQRSSGAPAEWDNSGTYVVRVVGKNSIDDGNLGVTTYLLPPGGMAQLLEKLFDESNYNILSDETVKSFFNPFQYIVSVMWFPIRMSYMTNLSRSREIWLGWFNSGIRGTLCDRINVVYSISCAIPPRYYNDFRDVAADWATYRIMLPGVGVYPLNPRESGFEAVHAQYSIDILTGECMVTLFKNVGGVVTGGFYAQLSGRLGIPVQIGQLTAQTKEAATSAVGGLVSLFTGNFKDSITESMNAGAEMCQPTMSVNGSAGNAASLIFTGGKIVISLHVIKGNPVATGILGRPVMKRKLLSDFTGYLKTYNCHIEMGGTERERQLIDRALDGGIIIE